MPSYLKAKTFKSAVRFFYYFAATVVALLIACEILLRAYALILMSQQQTNINQDKQKVVIVALGESTTYRGIPSSWPSELEKELNRLGTPAHVINLGRPATTSTFLLSRLEQLLETTTPDVVISMIGVNDTQSLWLTESHKSGENSFTKNLRIAKVFHYIVSDIKKRMLYKKVYFEEDLKKAHPSDLNIESTQDLVEKIKRHGYQDLRSEVIVKIMALSKLDKARYLSFLANEVRPAYGADDSEFADALVLYQEALKFSFRVHHLVEHVLLFSMYFKDLQGCKELAKKLKDSNYQMTEVAFMRFANCSARSENKAFWKNFFADYGFDVERVDSASEVTVRNHLKILKLLNMHNVLYVPMQYPLRPVEDLKGFFPKEDSPAAFISNEKNFAQALQSHKFSEIFVDLFAGEFGHMTNLGHQLIAKAAAPVVIEALKRAKKQ